VIGAFSWTTIEEAHWLTHGLWHSSLVLSILGILLSASQVTVLHILGPIPMQTPPSTANPSRPQTSQASRTFHRYQPLLLSKGSSAWMPRRKMVFTWQAPMMFTAYSVCAFLVGLTVLVCTPLMRLEEDGWGDGCSIAVMYLTVSVVAGTSFVFCSFWVYHYVDLDFDAQEDGGRGVGGGEGGFLRFGREGGSPTEAAVVPGPASRGSVDAGGVERKS
ncbi:hypothetical protein BDV95DRAFT_648059, partial [Massariosphaeria phaeospora]